MTVIGGPRRPQPDDYESYWGWCSACGMDRFSSSKWLGLWRIRRDRMLSGYEKGEHGYTELVSYWEFRLLGIWNAFDVVKPEGAPFLIPRWARILAGDW